MKIVTETLNRSEFFKRIIDDVHNFRSHVFRISCQFKEQRNLKENLPSNHAYIHMDFAEDYKCRSQNEVQSAYWSQTQVTIHPVVMYYKKNEKLEHKSYVFISNESRHDPVFVFTLIQKLIPLLKETLPNLEMIHYWTDSPTSQYRNKTIFKIVSCHDDYFGCKASWSYMESGHGKGPCDPIGGTAKRKADQAVKNGKCAIQDVLDFYDWAKSNSTAITYTYISIEDYENACFCKKCFSISFQSATCCNGWKEVSVIKSNKTTKTKQDNKEEKKCNEEKALEECVEPNVNDFVAAVYERKVYVGKVHDVDVDDSEAYIHFLTHTGTLNRNSKFREPKVIDDVWLSFDDILCITPEPVATKRALEICPEALDIVLRNFQDWQQRR